MVVASSSPRAKQSVATDAMRSIEWLASNCNTRMWCRVPMHDPSRVTSAARNAANTGGSCQSRYTGA
jgi:hypothetical protein